MKDNKKKPEQDKKSDQKKSGGQMNLGGKKFNVYWIYIIIILGILGLQFFYSGKSAVETTWSEVQSKMLYENDIDKLVLVKNLGIVEVYLKNQSLSKYPSKLGENAKNVSPAGPHFYFTVGSIEFFETQLKEAQADKTEKVGLTYETRPNYFGEALSWLLPIIILVAVWLFIFRKMNRGAGGAGGPGNIFSVGKSKAKLFDK
ncbi:MAG TPA: ATP-dependent metallopeptidase FtsH/Yme1/Tma family protein, partial [Perlabentimonas sp.]|nr:ATP-dependent metallopeptidase FtsH/Yme1/Tma family protein [Perlabentimonas sp.]